jgi:hypothetical protein
MAETTTLQRRERPYLWSLSPRSDQPLDIRSIKGGVEGVADSDRDRSLAWTSFDICRQEVTGEISRFVPKREKVEIRKRHGAPKRPQLARATAQIVIEQRHMRHDKYKDNDKRVFTAFSWQQKPGGVCVLKWE